MQVMCYVLKDILLKHPLCVNTELRQSWVCFHVKHSWKVMGSHPWTLGQREGPQFQSQKGQRCWPSACPPVHVGHSRCIAHLQKDMIWGLVVQTLGWWLHSYSLLSGMPWKLEWLFWFPNNWCVVLPPPHSSIPPVDMPLQFVPSPVKWRSDVVAVATMQSWGHPPSQVLQGGLRQQYLTTDNWWRSRACWRSRALDCYPQSCPCGMARAAQEARQSSISSISCHAPCSWLISSSGRARHASCV